MKIFHKKYDLTDVYGIKNKSESPFDRKNEDDAPESSRRHSDYYHKYFRGYTEIRRLDAKGRVKAERYYTQPWIVSKLPAKKYWGIRLLYILLAVMSAGIFLAALSQRIPGNYSVLVALPGYASVILLFLLIVSVLAYMFAEKKMTLWGYASSTNKLKRFSAVTAIGQVLTAIAMIVFALVSQVYVSESLNCAGAILLSAICSGAIFFVERKLPYAEIPNETKLPAGDAYEIW